MQVTDAIVPSLTDVPVLPATSASAHLDAVLVMTRDIFPGEVTWRSKADPEIADETFLSIRVRADGPASAIAEKDALWHRRLLELAPDLAGCYRLSMEVR